MNISAPFIDRPVATTLLMIAVAIQIAWRSRMKSDGGSGDRGR
jgi:hypothetical protein